MTSRWLALLLATAFGLAAIPVSIAVEGGATIASAPTLTWGQPEQGIGGNNVAATQPWGAGGRTFWRLRVFAGDQITGTGHVATLNGCGTNRIELYDPSVTDATLQTAKPFLRAGTIFSGSCTSKTFTWAWSGIPFTGLATVWAAISSEAPTFMLTAHVRHRTTLKIAALPAAIPTAPSTIDVRAVVSSPAGAPAGRCAFDLRADGHRWKQLTQTPVNHGACNASLRTAGSHSLQLRLRFIPDSNWQPSTALTRQIPIG